MRWEHKLEISKGKIDGITPCGNHTCLLLDFSPTRRQAFEYFLLILASCRRPFLKGKQNCVFYTGAIRGVVCYTLFIQYLGQAALIPPEIWSYTSRTYTRNDIEVNDRSYRSIICKTERQLNSIMPHCVSVQRLIRLQKHSHWFLCEVVTLSYFRFLWKDTKLCLNSLWKAKPYIS